MCGLETGKLSAFFQRASLEDARLYSKWFGYYKESISIEDLPTRKSYKAQENTAELSLRPSWATKRLTINAEIDASTK